MEHLVPLRSAKGSISLACLLLSTKQRKLHGEVIAVMMTLLPDQGQGVAKAEMAPSGEKPRLPLGMSKQNFGSMLCLKSMLKIEVLLKDHALCYWTLPPAPAICVELTQISDPALLSMYSLATFYLWKKMSCCT